MPRHRLTRRAFLTGCLAGIATAGTGVRGWQREPEAFPKRERHVGRRLRRAGAHLRSRFRDLPRHFVFEYYPWYAADPWRHWNDAGRTPPGTIATNYMPRLGPYDSRSTRVIEQHARWIAESGVGAISLSWWGRGSFEDRAVPLVMDVMRDHGVHATFLLEPYAADRATRLVDDIKYLLREYGERRRWDGFLLPERADGSAAPVMKMFGSVVPPFSTDCLGVRRPVRDYVPDATWREQTTRLRREVAVDFERFTLLADTLNVERTLGGGFDGGTSFDPYFHPDRWPEAAGWFNAEDLLFVFAANAGFDGIAPLPPPVDDPCYRPPTPDPYAEANWADEQSRALAHDASAARIAESFERTIQLQLDAASTNERRGFFLVYVNSFNEWHEGTQFEPAVSSRQLSAAERFAFHNPHDGAYRLNALAGLMGEIL